MIYYLHNKKYGKISTVNYLKEPAMIVQKPGKVTDRITLLGRRESCIYHLDGGDEAVLLGGGMVHIIPDVLKQIEAFNIDEKKIRRLVLLHSHFDHCGIAAFFKKQWPWLTIVASKVAKELLAKPKVIENIRFMNQMSIDSNDMKHTLQSLGVEEFQGIAVEEVLSDGEKPACGDRTLEIIEVPGHSPCSIAVYVPEEKAMFTSDAAGIAAGDDIFTAANSNFDMYQQSLKKMAAYDINVQLAEHYGARTGKDAKEFLEKSMAAAAAQRRLIEESLNQTGDPGQSARDLTQKAMKVASSTFLPEEVVSLVTTQMVNFIHKKRQSSGE
jgi:2-aminobenzoylacetyl-CoA thioesterase